MKITRKNIILAAAIAAGAAIAFGIYKISKAWNDYAAGNFDIEDEFFFDIDEEPPSTAAPAAAEEEKPAENA